MALKDHKRLITWKSGEQEAHYSEDKVKSCIEEIKQKIKESHISYKHLFEIIDEATGFNDNSQTKPISDKDLKVGESRNSSVSVKDKTDTGEGPNIQPSPTRKLNWSGVCAVNDNRNQCSEENCILFPICKIKKKKEAKK